jgi:hypothetical protein
MNTIEPEFLVKNRSLTSFLRKDQRSSKLQELEQERNEWFISRLKEDSVSNEEEERLRIWKELDIFEYTYFRGIRINKYLFKLLYYLKIIRL